MKIPIDEEKSGLKYLGLRIKIMIIKIKGKKAKKRNTKRLELVRLISSFSNSFFI